MEDTVDKKVKVLSLWHSAETSQLLRQYGELKVTELTIEDVLGVRGIVLYDNNKVPQLIAKVKEVILVEQNEYILRIDSLHPCRWPDVDNYLRSSALEYGKHHKSTAIELEKTIAFCDTLPFHNGILARGFLTLADATEILARTYGVSDEQVSISISNAKRSGHVAKVVDSGIS